MKKSIKNRIITSNIVLVLFSIVIITLIIATFSLRNIYASTLAKTKDIESEWLSLQKNLQLSMTRWLSGTPYNDLKKNKVNIDSLLDKLSKNSFSFIYPGNLNKEISNMSSIWDFTKKERLDIIIESINNFIPAGKMEFIESDEKKIYIKMQKINYYKNLNFREVVYKHSAEEWDKYSTEAFRILENVDLFYEYTDNYSKKVKKCLMLSTDIYQKITTFTTVMIIALLIIQFFIGIMIAFKIGNAVSKPIMKSTNKLIQFVGESMDGGSGSIADEETKQLENCVDLLINYYKELSVIAEKLSIGDISMDFSPKSENDVMGKAFTNIISYLKYLNIGATHFVNGNYNYSLTPRSDKDILAATYNQLSKSIVDLLERTKEIARLESEMGAAARIQSSILPRQDENLVGYEIAHTCITATEVGGDNYDFRSTKNGNWISIGDVSGHGLEAGILALIAQSAFNYGAYLFEKDVSDNELQLKMYDYVNKTLVLLNRVRGKSDTFMTQNYLFERNGTFFCAGAHEIGLVYRKSTGEIEELKELAGRVPFMGIMSEINVSTSDFKFSMESGDILMLYTDGLIEAKNENSEQFDLFRLKNSFLKYKDSSVNDIKELVINELRDFCRDGDLKRYDGFFADDITILILKKE